MGMDVCLFIVVCCQVDVSATDRSLVQRSLTECAVSECDHEASIIRSPGPLGLSGHRRRRRIFIFTAVLFSELFSENFRFIACITVKSWIKSVTQMLQCWRVSHSEILVCTLRPDMTLVTETISCWNISGLAAWSEHQRMILSYTPITRKFSWCKSAI